MATKQSTIDFLTEQMQSAGDIRSRKMFGEYAIYCNEKVVAFVCDDKLFLKPVPEVRTLIKDLIEAPAYPGSKNYFLISEDYWDDADYLSMLIKITASVVPLPKTKKRN